MAMTAILFLPVPGSFPVLASGHAEAPSGGNTEDADISGSFDDSAVSRSEADRLDFSSGRLIVGVRNPDIIADPGREISHYQDTYLLQYSSGEEAENAYSYYRKHADFVSPDTKLKGAGGIGNLTEAGDTVSSSVPEVTEIPGDPAESPEESGSQDSDHVMADRSEITGTEDSGAAEGEQQIVPEKNDAFSELNDALADSADVGSQKTVAVIDSGMSGKNVVDAVSMIGDRTDDDNGHGTKSMETILSENSKAKLISIKALDANGYGDTSAIYAGIEYAKEQKANMIVLPLYTYSTEENAAIAEAVRSAVEDGITVVGAAGNDNADAQYYLPGNIEEALIAGACDDKGNKIESSNYGDTVDYNVVADSTSEASAKLAGYLSKAKGDAEEILKAEAAKKGWLFVPGEVKEDNEAREQKKIAEGKSAAVKYLCVDADAIESGDTIDSVILNKTNRVIMQFNVTQPIFEAGDGTYQIDAGLPWATGFASGEAKDYVFARASNKGQVITDGVSYDKASNMVTVSADALKKNDGDSADIQLQVLVPADVSRKASTEVTIQMADGNEVRSTISGDAFAYVGMQMKIDGKKEKLSGKDFSVYVNDAEESMDSDSLHWNADQNVLTIGSYAGVTKSVRIELSGNVKAVFKGAIADGRDVGTLSSIAALPDGTDPNAFYAGQYVETSAMWGNSHMGSGYEPSATTISNGNVKSLTDQFSLHNGYLGISKSAFGVNFDLRDVNNTSKSYGNWNGNNGYNVGIHMFCNHVRVGVNSNAERRIGIRVLKKWTSGKKTYIVLSVESLEAVTGTGEGTTNQTIGSIFQLEFTGKEQEGYLQLQKRSGNPQMTNGNSCYSLAGAQYGVYTDSKCTKAAKDTSGKTVVLKTDANGISQTVKMKSGTYYIKELKAPRGFKRNTAVKFINVYGKASDNDASHPHVFYAVDEPGADSMEIAIAKTGKGSSASLEGTEFTVSFYKNYYDSLSAIGNTVPAREWTFTTKKQSDGRYESRTIIDFLIESQKNLVNDRTPIYAVKRDDYQEYFYTTSYSEAMTLANLEAHSYFVGIAGYSHKTGNPVWRLTLDGAYHFYTATQSEVKAYEDMGWTSEGVRFRINSTDDLKLYRVFNPNARSTSLSHYLTPYESEKNYLVKSGWKEENSAIKISSVTSHDVYSVDGSTMEIPYGTIVIRETKAASGYKNDANFTSMDGKTSYGSVVVARVDANGIREVKTSNSPAGLNVTDSPIYTPSVRTALAGTGDDEHYEEAKAGAVLTDTVRLIHGNDYAGKTITVSGVLYDQSTGKPLEINGKQVTASATGTVASDGTATVKNKFKFDASGLAGKTVVAAETIAVDGKTMASHSDLNDTNQMVRFPGGRTTAKDQVTGNHLSCANGKVTIVDTVDYTNLKPGKTYTVTGKLMDRDLSTKDKIVYIKDKNGKVVTSSKKFTCAEGGSGTVEITFTFDAAGDLAGKTAVAEEKVPGYFTHADLNDTGQTIHFPKIETSAKDGQTGTAFSKADREITIVDRVSYRNIMAGKTYLLTGTIMDKATGKALKDPEGNAAVSSVKLSPSSASGTVSVPFRLDASSLMLDGKNYSAAGKDIVVFERMTSGGKTVAAHENINDEGQTIHFTDVHTSLAKADGDPYLKADGNQQVIDTIDLDNIHSLSGKVVTVRGALYDKADGNVLCVGGREVTAENSVRVTEDTKHLTNTFTFDASGLEGHTLVATEKVYLDGKEIGRHTDLNDTKQMVFIPKIRTTLTDRTTGNHLSNAGQSTVVLVDTVRYENLKPGKTYTAVGTLMDRATGKDLTDADGKVITARTPFTCEKRGSGMVTVTFEFVPPKDLAGKSVVAREEVPGYAMHSDVGDLNQTVDFPEIKTKAKAEDTENPVTAPDGDVTITDTVSCRNVEPGKSYVVRGTLMDKETGKPLTDRTGKNITAESESFIPERNEAAVDVVFSFDAENLMVEGVSWAAKGKDVVVFESMTTKGENNEETIVAVHEDLNDEGQTIHFPGGHTEAKDARTGSKMTGAEKNAEIIDRVTYTNLLPEHEYTITGTLMNQSTGEPVTEGGEAVTGSAVFTTPESEDGEDSVSGTEEVVFRFDASSLKGQTLVAFEKMTDNGVTVFVHEDIRDQAQTIYIPEISTILTGKDGTSKVIRSRGTVTLVDTVSYSNLEPQKEYTMTGKLVDQSGTAYTRGGSEITSEKKFTPDKPDGTVEMTFVIDTGNLADESKIVAYEYLTLANGEQVAKHENPEDENQTVTYRKPTSYVTGKKTGGSEKTTGYVRSNPKTGDTASASLFASVFCASLAAAVLFRIRQKKRRTHPSGTGRMHPVDKNDCI